MGLHVDYKFYTLKSFDNLFVPYEIKKIIPKITSCAGVSDILRLIALYNIGGIYLDTDVMPLRSFDKLIELDKPFLAKRSSKSFESAIIGSPKNHKAIKDVIDAFPKWYYEHLNNSASVQTGPTFVSSVLFGRDDVAHLPSKTFYPFNGFMAPKRHEKELMFQDKTNFPIEMIAAHYSNHRWGGKP